MLLNFKYIVKEDLAKLAKAEIVGWPYSSNESIGYRSKKPNNCNTNV